jgi:hypothetical protein
MDFRKFKSQAGLRGSKESKGIHLQLIREAGTCSNKNSWNIQLMFPFTMKTLIRARLLQVELYSGNAAKTEKIHSLFGVVINATTIIPGAGSTGRSERFCLRPPQILYSHYNTTEKSQIIVHRDHRATSDTRTLDRRYLRIWSLSSKAILTQSG